MLWLAREPLGKTGGFFIEYIYLINYNLIFSKLVLRVNENLGEPMDVKIK